MFWSGPLLTIASAVLFGASAPFAKLLIADGVDPWLLAGLLYLGSGARLCAVHFGRRAFGLEPAEAPLRRADLPWLALIVLSGGIVGPALLMLGLATMPAAAASLLLNLESVATLAIAWLAFQPYRRRARASWRATATPPAPLPRISAADSVLNPILPSAALCSAGRPHSRRLPRPEPARDLAPGGRLG